ncbi:hypothetical protein K502DRAFT_366557 [Neoconidiobolus thromboides FSU 785]|nr:hypothetical protein K502DRAFT_366557 [Neoconidiobolus thromboides FSU 785]
MKGSPFEEFIPLSYYIVISISLIEILGNYFQWQKSSEKEISNEFEGVIHSKVLQKIQVVNEDRSALRFYKSIFSLLEFITFFYFDAFFYLWDYSKSILESVGYQNIINQSILFFNLYLILITLLNLPFDIHNSIFIIKEYQADSKGVIMSLIKSLISTMFQSIVVKVIIEIASRNINKEFGIYRLLAFSWLLFTVFQFIYSIILPHKITPFYYKMKRTVELEEGFLKEKIVKLSNSINIPLKKIYINNSPSKLSNIFSSLKLHIYGFDDKTIILSKELINNKSNDEIVIIIATKLIQSKLGYSFNCRLKDNLIVLINMYLFNTLTTQFYTNDSIPVIVAVVYIIYFVSPINLLIEIFFNLILRSIYFEIDKTIVDTYDNEINVKENLICSYYTNLGEIRISKLYSIINYQKPRLTERVMAIDYYIQNEYKKKKKKLSEARINNSSAFLSLSASISAQRPR